MTASIEYIRRGDELVVHSNGVRASAQDFKSGRNVVLIHGFTAHGSYLSEIGDDLRQGGFSVFIYNYNSFNGIDRAAQTLYDILENINQLGDNCVEEKKIMLVCHSMGGLVGRSLCQLSRGDCFISKIVTIGTPHVGTLQDSNFLRFLVRLGERLAGNVAVRGYRPDCKSALQLLQQDATTGDTPFLSKLNSSSNGIRSVQKFSISGGKRRIELGQNPVYNILANKYIQGKLKDTNDGLVLEKSSDWTTNFPDTCPTTRPLHLGNYPEFDSLNHSFLIKNNFISLRIASFLSDDQ